MVVPEAVPEELWDYRAIGSPKENYCRNYRTTNHVVGRASGTFGGANVSTTLIFPTKLSAVAVLSLANQLLNLVRSSTRPDSQTKVVLKVTRSTGYEFGDHSSEAQGLGSVSAFARLRPFVCRGMWYG